MGSGYNHLSNTQGNGTLGKGSGVEKVWKCYWGTSIRDDLKILTSHSKTQTKIS